MGLFSWFFRRREQPKLDLAHPKVIALAERLRVLHAMPIGTKEQREVWYAEARKIGRDLRTEYREIYDSLPHEMEHYLADADIRARDPEYAKFQATLLADLFGGSNMVLQKNDEISQNKAIRLPMDASDDDLLRSMDQWAALLEAEDYEAAYAYTDHDPRMGWTPELIRQVIKSYGDADPTQRVTVAGKPTDIRQRKEVDRWPVKGPKGVGDIWYDLNIDGFASDLTATFWIIETDGGLTLQLNDIHVM